MIAKLFLGCIMILVFLCIYPYFISLWTSSGGFNDMMANTTMSDMETSIWGLFPVAFLVMGVGGIAWLIVRDRDK